MDYSELIREYIVNSYKFSSNIDGWCVKDIHQGRNILLKRMSNDLERVFPEMDSSTVCSNWWYANKKIVEYKIDTYLSSFHLTLGSQTNHRAWEVVNHFGKRFDMKELMKLLPNHHNESAIYKIFDEWYDERVNEATERIY